jgi:hypothetical protein
MLDKCFERINRLVEDRRKQEHSLLDVEDPLTLSQFQESDMGLTPIGDFFDVQNSHLFRGGNFDGAKIRLQNHCAFHGCVFIASTLDQPDSTRKTEFVRCRFVDCHFVGSFGHIIFKDCEFLRVRFAYSFTLQTLRIQKTTGLETCQNLERLSVTNEYHRRLFERDLADTPLPFPYRRFAWAKLRGFGGLPFFGFSYGGTALILFLLSVIDSYNSQLRDLNAWGSVSESAGALGSLVTRLNPIVLSCEILMLLAGAVSLIVASTIYAWRCPERVKEFSLERWTNELGKEAISYVSLSWRDPFWRLVCGTCFYLGSFLTALVLLLRLWEGISQALRNW